MTEVKPLKFAATNVVSVCPYPSLIQIPVFSFQVLITSSLRGSPAETQCLKFFISLKFSLRINDLYKVGGAHNVVIGTFCKTFKTLSTSNLGISWINTPAAWDHGANILDHADFAHPEKSYLIFGLRHIYYKYLGKSCIFNIILVGQNCQILPYIYINVTYEILDRIIIAEIL